MDDSGTESRPTLLEPPDYVNPLESSSRWYLAARAQAVRYAASLGFGIANRTDPPAPAPSRDDVWLHSTLSPTAKGRDKIRVEIWVPPRLTVGARPAVIDFHGGGWILGAGTDDARWAGSVMGALDAVVFTVNYRLAPTYPFPTAIEDCVDAVTQIIMRAPEFNIDPAKIILSGFSAGATNVLTTWLILQDPARWGYELPITVPCIMGLALFYPVLDYTISRPEKRLTCKRPELTLSKGLTDLTDASYIYPAIPREKRTNPLLSPGLMPDDLFAKLPPIHLVLCEYDMLLAEGMRFAQRLEAADKPFTIRIVVGEKHAWDKPPGAPLESVNTEYEVANESMASWLGRSCDPDRESMRSMKTKRPLLKRPRYLSFRSKTTG